MGKPSIEDRPRGLSLSGANAPRVLLAATNWWSFPTRFAMGFMVAGYAVEVICPTHHPFAALASIAHRHRFDPLRPLAALDRVLGSKGFDLVVPCDCRAVHYLHEIHRRARPGSAVRALVERSLGDPRSFEAADRRSRLIEIARAEGIPAPEMLPVASLEELAAAGDRIGYPAILKSDRSWGGLGVVEIATAAAAPGAWRRLRRRPGLHLVAKRWLIHRDRHPARQWLAGELPRLNLQALATGRPATTAIACRDGAVLGLLHAEIVSSAGARGPSTVVRLIQHDGMEQAARRLIARLGVSGFCGLDFLIGADGVARLLEMNFRCTQLGTLPLPDGGGDLVAALARAFGRDVAATRLPIDADLIAFFPDGAATTLPGVHLDVPTDEPALVRALTRPAWPDGNPVARLARSVRRRLRPKARETVAS